MGLHEEGEIIMASPGKRRRRRIGPPKPAPAVVVEPVVVEPIVVEPIVEKQTPTPKKRKRKTKKSFFGE